jgi:hypothetical protein
MSRAARRRKRQAEQAVGEVTDFINDNPVTSSVAALLAGALATSLFKMTADGFTQRGARQASDASKESPEPGED